MKAELSRLSEREAEAIGDLLIEHHETLGISFERLGQIIGQRLGPAFGHFADAPLYARLCGAHRANTPDEVDARSGKRIEGEYIYGPMQQRPPNGAWFYQVDCKDERFPVRHFRIRGSRAKAYAQALDYQKFILSAMADDK